MIKIIWSQNYQIFFFVHVSMFLTVVLKISSIVFNFFFLKIFVLWCVIVSMNFFFIHIIFILSFTAVHLISAVNKLQRSFIIISFNFWFEIFTSVQSEFSFQTFMKNVSKISLVYLQNIVIFNNWVSKWDWLFNFWFWKHDQCDK